MQVAGEEAVQGAGSPGDGGVGVDEHDADDDGRCGRHDAHDLGKHAVSGSALNNNVHLSCSHQCPERSHDT